MHQHGGDIYTNQHMLDFSANINFLGMPEAVSNAARKAIAASVSYPDPRCRALKEAIAQKDGVDGGMIFCGNGAAEVIFSLVRAVAPKEALLPVPSFYEYEAALLAAGARVQYLSLSGEGGFSLTEDILEQITDRTELLFLCNPNNPTGLLIDPGLLNRILGRCEETGTILVVDECFLDLCLAAKRHSLVPMLSQSRQLVLLKAFTKTYAMPGLRLGYALSGNRALLARMEECSPPWRVSLPAEAAGIAACGEVDFVKRSAEAIAGERDFLAAELAKLGLLVYPGAANFLFWQGEAELARACQTRGILLRDCRNYRGLPEGYYRCAVRGREDNLRLLACLREVIWQK